MTSTCVILAKGHSNRLSNKNILPFAGKPLVVRCIETAKQSGVFDRIVVDTDSDNVSILCEGLAEVHRRCPSLQGDEISSVDVVLGINDICQCDIITLLQVTSPLLMPSHVRDAYLKLSSHSEAYSLVSVKEVKEARRLYVGDDYLIPLRDSSEIAFTTNGAIWMANSNKLLEYRSFITPLTLRYIMEPYLSIDIDTRYDFDQALSVWERINVDKHNS